MNEEQVKNLIKAGEGQNIEFKRKARGLQRELAAFANAEGGKIIIGVDDDGTIVGVKNKNEERAKVRSAARSCEPSIDLDIEEVGDVLVVKIPENKDAVRASDGFYTRQGATSQKLTKREIMGILHSKGDITFDERICHGFRYPEDFDSEVFQDFLQLSSITDNIDRESLLLNLGVADYDGKVLKLTNAGVLMFGKNPKKFFTQAEVICGAYESKDKVKIKDRRIISKPIIPSIRSAVDFIVKNTQKKFVIDGLQRRQIPEYPEEALREAVVNALIHRDYYNTKESINIDVFPNEVRINNPGGLVEGLELEELGKKSIRRNPKIADLLDRADFVERMGTGILRMKKAMENRNLPEPRFNENDHFEVILESKGQQTPDLSNADLNPQQKKALEYIYQEGRITNAEYRELTDVTRQTALRHLKDMVEKNLIKQKGQGRGAYYTLP